MFSVAVGVVGCGNDVAVTVAVVVVGGGVNVFAAIIFVAVLLLFLFFCVIAIAFGGCRVPIVIIADDGAFKDIVGIVVAFVFVDYGIFAVAVFC